MSTTAIVARKPMPHMTDALTSLFLRGATVSSSQRLIDFIAVSATVTASLIVGILLFIK